MLPSSNNPKITAHTIIIPLTPYAMRIRDLLLSMLLLTGASMSAEIKYVFLMIGDGMGVNQVFATERYRLPAGRPRTRGSDNDHIP